MSKVSRILKFCEKYKISYSVFDSPKKIIEKFTNNAYDSAYDMKKFSSYRLFLNDCFWNPHFIYPDPTIHKHLLANDSYRIFRELPFMNPAIFDRLVTEYVCQFDPHHHDIAIFILEMIKGNVGSGLRYRLAGSDRKNFDFKIDMKYYKGLRALWNYANEDKVLDEYTIFGAVLSNCSQMCPYIVYPLLMAMIEKLNITDELIERLNIITLSEKNFDILFTRNICRNHYYIPWEISMIYTSDKYDVYAFWMVSVVFDTFLIGNTYYDKNIVVKTFNIASNP